MSDLDVTFRFYSVLDKLPENGETGWALLTFVGSLLVERNSPMRAFSKIHQFVFVDDAFHYLQGLCDKMEKVVIQKGICGVYKEENHYIVTHWCHGFGLETDQNYPTFKVHQELIKRRNGEQ
jgi:hypothetical protein